MSESSWLPGSGALSDRDPQWSLAEGMWRSGMTWQALWLRQLSVGGTLSELELEAYVLGLLQADAYQHDVIAQALNEHFLDCGAGHPVAYWSTVPSSKSHDHGS